MSFRALYLFIVALTILTAPQFSLSLNAFTDVNAKKPPVFYADNGNDQTIAFPLNRNRERREFRTEILQFLGLSHEPHPKRRISLGVNPHVSPDTAAPLYMLDLYKALQPDDDEEDMNEMFGDHQQGFSFLREGPPPSSNQPSTTGELFDPLSADTIMSFVNQEAIADRNERANEYRLRDLAAADSHPNANHLHFDLSIVRPDFQLIGAELRVFYNSTGKRGRVNLYILKATSYNPNTNTDDDPLSLVTSTLIDPNEGPQWLLFNVTTAVASWRNGIESVLRKDLFLLLETVNANGYNAPPKEFGLTNAFLVVFFNGDNESAHQRSRRTRRGAGYGRGVSRREDNEWPSPWTNFDAKWSRSICQKRTLYVSFRDLGWQDWIIAPDGYAAYYCYGECSFPLNAHMNATNHAIVQTLAHLMNPESVPKPCCAPNKLQPISVLYFDDSNNVVLKKYNNMVVKSCGCH